MTDPVTTPSSGFIMSPALYDKMKFTVQTALPAISTLYFTLGAIWDLPAVTQVIGTLAALATFLGVLVGVSSKTYSNSEARFDGHIAITQTPEGTKLYSLEFDGDPHDIDQKDAVTFRVGTPNQ